MPNHLAWRPATFEDAQLRHGAYALGLAERACQLLDYNIATIVDTLPAAYAQVGQFDQAVKNAEKAIKPAQAAGKEKPASDIQS